MSVAPQEVRIIGGDWRRSKLPVLNKPGLRPTPDRVRETLFNWLGQDLTGWRVLDAFAGTGALGFEAASRGAARVLLIERDAQVARQLQANAQRLKANTLEVCCQDALVVLRGRPHEVFDLAFIDPPYAAQASEAALQAVCPWLAAQARVYLEADHAMKEAELANQGWALLRQLKAGAVHAHLLEKQEKTD